MHVATRLPALFHELVHERQDGIADNIGLAPQEVEIQAIDVGSRPDVVGSFGRDDPAACLGTRQRHLNLDVARDEGVVGKDVTHARGAEGVTEEDGIEDGGGGRDRGLSHEFPPH